MYKNRSPNNIQPDCCNHSEWEIKQIKAILNIQISDNQLAFT